MYFEITTAGELGLLVLWIASAGVAIGLTVRWFRRFRRSEAFWSIVCTTLAGLPGVVLLVEYVFRLLQQSWIGGAGFEFAFPSTLLSILWCGAGPLLLIGGFVARYALPDVPRGTGLVQFTHVVMWLWSTIIGLAFASTM